MLTHVYIVGEQLVLLGVDDGEGVDGYQDLVTLTVNSYRVIEVLVFIVRSELNIYVLGDTGRYHPLLIVLDLEVRSAWG